MILDRGKYFLIPFYKSPLFYFCKFETKSLDEQDIIIVNALNIKNRKKRITYLYDCVCDYIDNFYGGKNICGFKRSQCCAQRKIKTSEENGCCRRCAYRSSKGCTTKNLACKLFVCSEVSCKRKVLKYEDLISLKVLSARQRFIIKSDFFSSREDVLKDLYSYSFIYSTIRVVFRHTSYYIRSLLKK